MATAGDQASTSYGICALPIEVTGEEPVTDEPTDISGWQILDFVSNAGLCLMGLCTLGLQIAWLSSGDTRVAAFLWTGPAISVNGVLSLARILTSSPRHVMIAAFSSPVSFLAILCSLIFGIIVGTTEKLPTGIFIIGGSVVTINYITLPASIVSGIFSWAEFLKSIKVSKNSIGPPISSIAATVSQDVHSMAPPSGNDGYETPITKQPRRFRRPRPPASVETIPIKHRSLPSPPIEGPRVNHAFTYDNDGEDEYTEQFILSEGYMTPTSELRAMRDIARNTDTNMENIAKLGNKSVERTRSPSNSSEPPRKDCDDMYNEIPLLKLGGSLGMLEDVHGDLGRKESVGFVISPKSSSSSALDRLKCKDSNLSETPVGSTKSSHEIVRDHPENIKQLNRIQKPKSRAAFQGNGGGDNNHLDDAEKVHAGIEITREFGVRMVVNRRDVNETSPPQPHDIGIDKQHREDSTQVSNNNTICNQKIPAIGPGSLTWPTGQSGEACSAPGTMTENSFYISASVPSDSEDDIVMGNSQTFSKYETACRKRLDKEKTARILSNGDEFDGTDTDESNGNRNIFQHLSNIDVEQTSVKQIARVDETDNYLINRHINGSKMINSTKLKDTEKVINVKSVDGNVEMEDEEGYLKPVMFPIHSNSAYSSPHASGSLHKTAVLSDFAVDQRGTAAAESEGLTCTEGGDRDRMGQGRGLLYRSEDDEGEPYTLLTIDYDSHRYEKLEKAQSSESEI